MSRRSLAWTVALLGVAMTVGVSEAQSPAQQDRQRLAQQDRQRIMNLLGITSIPPGAQSSNPDTYDESKAEPFPALPHPLVMNDGRRVTSADMWWKLRRPEIVEDFEREVYGRTPKNTPTVRWEVTSTVNDGTTVTKTLVGHVDNSSYRAVTVDIQLMLATPAAAKGPVPVIMQLNFALAGRGRAGPPAARGAAPFTPPPGSWQQQVLAKGWGWAQIVPTSIQGDSGADLTQGIIGLVNKGRPRKLDDWGALKAWAWGASRALDYFETDTGRRCKARRHPGTFAVRQGGDCRHGLRPAICHRLHQLVRCRRRQAAPPEVRRGGRERARGQRVPLDGGQLLQVRG